MKYTGWCQNDFNVHGYIPTVNQDQTALARVRHCLCGLAPIRPIHPAIRNEQIALVTM